MSNNTLDTPDLKTQQVKTVTNHFLQAAPELFREPKDKLRHPFIVPGAQDGAELWVGLFVLA